MEKELFVLVVVLLLASIAVAETQLTKQTTPTETPELKANAYEGGISLDRLCKKKHNQIICVNELNGTSQPSERW